MLESLRYSGFLVCNVLSSLGTVFVTMRSIDAFRGVRVHYGPALCNFEFSVQPLRDVRSRMKKKIKWGRQEQPVSVCYNLKP
jgi:hypothetical protein